MTTIVGGNCGFTLAPIKAEDADYLRRMMAKVEGMPLPALEQGVPWNWSSFGEYLDRLDGNVAVNTAFLVGPLRAPPQRDGRRRGRQRGLTRAHRAHGAAPARVDRRGRARLLDHARVHALRWRRPAGRVPMGVEGRSARAVRSRARPRGHDARVRHRRLHARFPRRRGRAHGRDDARRPAPPQLERAHGRRE